MGLYGFTYTSFIAIEFSLYESLLQFIERKSNQKSLLAGLLELIPVVSVLSEAFKQQQNADSSQSDQKKRQHYTADVMLAGVFAGSIAGFATNSIEYLAVNKQANP